MADNQPDNLPTNPQDNNSTECEVHQTEQSIGQTTSDEDVKNSKISILELQKKYGIGRDPLYTRMRYLQIKTWKLSGKAYLYADQVAHMDTLHEHIKATGRMEGYPVPPASGPIEEEQPAPTTTLAVAETQQIAAPNYAPKQKRSQPSQEVDDVAAIVQSAQGKAAGTLIAENILARHFIENPELLPDELKSKIKESAQMPEIDPFAYANALTDLVKLSGAAA